MILKRAGERAETKEVMTATLDEPRLEQRSGENTSAVPPRFEVFNVLSLGMVAVALTLAAAFAFDAIPADQVEALGRLSVAAVLGLSSLIISRSVNAVGSDAARAWSMLASGISAFAVAGFVTAVLGTDAFPAYVDPFLGIFLVLTVIGIQRLPHFDGTAHTRLRIAVDVLAGTVAVGALALEAVTADETELSLVTVARPAIGLLLAGALLLAAVRRGLYRYDRRLLAFLIGSGLTAASLMFGSVLVSQPATAMAIDLTAAGAFAFLAWAIRQPVPRRTADLGRTPTWKLAVPYSLVAALFAVFFLRAVTEDATLDGFVPWAVLVVLALLVVRQVAATQENRSIIEMERDQLIASLSHELRTPLTAVTGFADVIWDQWGSLTQQDARDMMEIIRTQAHHLSGLITDVVALVRDELDSVRLDLERIDARELIGSAIKSVFDVNGGDIPVTAKVEPYTELIGDRSRLHQVLVAMLKNAQRYGNGKILIIAYRTKEGRLLEVHDDGEGLPAKYETLVWDRFERGAHQLNSNVPGSGLGLTIVRSMAEAHGGKAVYRRSEKLGGACFSIELPYEKVKAQVDHSETRLETSR